MTWCFSALRVVGNWLAGVSCYFSLSTLVAELARSLGLASLSSSTALALAAHCGGPRHLLYDLRFTFYLVIGVLTSSLD